jgi:MFS family permease
MKHTPLRRRNAESLNNSSNKQLVPQPRNFRLMVAGQLVTVMGSTLLRFALSLYVLDITGRVDVFASLFAISNIPILLAPIGGAIADRLNRHRLMVMYDAICCAITIAFLAALMNGHASVLVIGTVMVLLGTVGAIETPNGTACLPLLVPQSKLESSNGIIQAVQALSGIVAPFLGGILYGVLGINALVIISSASFGLASAVELFIEIPFEKRLQGGCTTQVILMDLKDGFRYVWANPFTRKLSVVAAMLNLALAPCFLVASPIILRVTMSSDDIMYGVGMGLIQFAAMIGALTAGVFSKRMHLNTLWCWILGIAFLFIPMALSVTPLALKTGFWPPFALFLLSITIVVAVTSILNIFAIARIQEKTPNEKLGKVMAIVQAVAQCAAPVGQFIYGATFQSFSARPYLPLLFSACLMACIALSWKAMLKNE